MENNFKRFLSLVLALIMVVGMMPMGHVHAEVNVDGNTINMVVGDTYTITLGNEEPAVSGGEGVVSAATSYTTETTKEFDRNAPFTDLDNFVNGTYVIYSARDGGSGSYAYTTNPVIANAITSGSNKGLEIVPLADIDERAYWTITKIPVGETNAGMYTISYGGLNVSINATNDVTLAEGAVVEIVNNDNATYPDAVAIRNSSGLCLNTYNSFGNASSTGQAASAWGTAIGDDGMQFYLYPVHDVTVYTYSVTLTAEAAGNAEITIGDTTYIVNVAAEACEHPNGSWAVTTAATCGADGVKTFTCPDCGHTETEVIPATGEHSWDEGVYTDPTTEADGYTTYTCTVCNATNVVIDEGSQLDPIVVDPFNKDNWTKISVDSETTKANENANEGEFAQAWDGDTDTKWHSNWRAADGTLGKLKAHGESNAFEVISGEIDFGAEAYINRFSFLPRQDDTGHSNGDGVVTKASLYVKDADDTEWKLVAENVEFTHDQQWKTFEFSAQNVKQVRFEATRSVYNGWVVVSEFDIGYEEEHTYTEEIITQATCNQPGLKRLTCSNGINGADCTCHHTYTVEIPATGEHTYDNACDADCNVCGEVRTPADHVYDNDTDTDCNVCGAVREVEPALFKIAFSSMTMANSLDMNFAFAQNNADDWTGYYAMIQKIGANNSVVQQRVDVDTTKEVTIDNVKYYYVTFTGIAAKEMTDELHVTIYNADGEAVSETWIDSVRDHAIRNLELHKDDAENCTMVVDMLNYGAEAQKNAGYKTDDLANAQLTEEQKAYATTSVEYTNEMTNSNSSIKYLANVKMVENIQFMMAFYGVDENMTIKVSYRHWNSTEDIVKEFKVSELQKSGSYYVITLEETVMADGFQTITSEVIDADGNVVATITDSMASYAARAKSSTNSELYDAIMKFSTSALDYLSK